MNDWHTDVRRERWTERAALQIYNAQNPSMELIVFVMHRAARQGASEQ